jgi:PAS domain S-box-containing protein
MDTLLNVLIIEDSEDDALLVLKELHRGGYKTFFERVCTPEAMACALKNRNWDIIIADYVMPRFSGLEALNLLKEKDLDLPFIIVSGKIGEDTAVEAIKAGANDYIMKGNLARLVPAIKRELREVEEHRARRKAIEDLAISEEKYHTLFTTMTHGVIYYDAEGNIFSANPAAEHIMGLTLDQMRGQTPADLDCRTIHEDGTDFPGETHPAMIALKTGKEVRDVVMGIYHPKEESYHWLNICAVPFFKPNEHRPYQVYSLLKDFTERKLAENKIQEQSLFLQRIIDNIPSPVFYKDTSGIYQGCNAAFESYMGLDKREIIGKTVFDIYPGDLAERYHEMDLVLFHKPGIQSYETTTSNADRARRDIIINKASYSNIEGEIAGLVGVMTDITERKEGEELFKTLSNSSPVGIYIIQDGKFQFVNPQFQSLTGYSADELIGNDASMIVLPKDKEMARKNTVDILKGRRSSPHEFRSLTKSGKTRWALEQITSIMYKGKQAVLANYIDITDLKQTEEDLRYAHQRVTDIIDFLPDATFVIDNDKKVIAWNRAIEEMTGVKKEEIIGKGEYAYALPFYGFARPILIDYIFHDSTDQTDYNNISKSGDKLYTQTYVPQTFQGKGAVLWGTASPLFNDKGNIVGAIESIRDVTEQTQTKEQLLHRLSIEEAISRISSILISPEEVDFNEILMILGEKFSAKRVHLFQLEQETQKVNAVYEWCDQQTEPYLYKLDMSDITILPFAKNTLLKGENFILSDINDLSPDYAAEKETLKAINVFSLLIVPIISTKGLLAGVLGFVDSIKTREWSSFDIKIIRIAAEMVGAYCEQQHAKQAIQQSEQKLRNIVEHSTNLFFSYTPENLFTYVSPQANSFLDCSPGEALVDRSNFITDNPQNSAGLISSQRAIDTGTPQPLYKLELVGKKGRKIWVEVSETPVVHDGKTVAMVGAFTEITERLQNEEKLQQSFEKLKNTLEATVNALSNTVETKDPYTAGHQRRVSELAVAIAKEMSLSNQILDGIRIAGNLHDLGKIYIPSEILSKPGRINNLEFNLIKAHSQIGYDIIKNIDFTAPVAQIILQHHERENGTGYPSGLSKKDILLEAKIMAVADVFEAMSSHRPYRPALGEAAALEEIMGNKGTLYDNNVADALYSLIKDKDFKFLQ